MFLRAKNRFKDGKEHHYWSVVENHRMANNRVVQRQALYLGEMKDSQHASWCRAIDAFQDGDDKGRQLALFPSGREAPELACEVVQIKVKKLKLHRPGQWGACWLACHLWNLLGTQTASKPRDAELAQCSQNPGCVSPDFSRQRVALTSPLVSQ